VIIPALFVSASAALRRRERHFPERDILRSRVVLIAECPVDDQRPFRDGIGYGRERLGRLHGGERGGVQDLGPGGLAQLDEFQPTILRDVKLDD
jgi:hypothetical protein